VVVASEVEKSRPCVDLGGAIVKIPVPCTWGANWYRYVCNRNCIEFI